MVWMYNSWFTHFAVDWYLAILFWIEDEEVASLPFDWSSDFLLPWSFKFIAILEEPKCLKQCLKRHNHEETFWL